MAPVREYFDKCNTHDLILFHKNTVNFIVNQPDIENHIIADKDENENKPYYCLIAKPHVPYIVPDVDSIRTASYVVSVNMWLERKYWSWD